MSTRPEPTVLATAVPKAKAATKLKTAAQMTALPGLRTRVETTVAIEFAASWKPLMKSNASATKISPMTARRLASIRSGVLHDDALEDVGDVFAAVGGLFEEVQNLFPLDDGDSVGFVFEERLHGGLVRAVGLVLEPVDLDRALGHALALFERLHRADHLLDRVADQPRELARAGPDGVDVIEPQDGRRGVDRIHHV